MRTASVATVGGDRAERFIGGDLLTLLYTVQIGTIAVHAWQARVQSRRSADSTTIDLDPAEGVPFSSVVALAALIKVELDRMKLRSALKTSGSSGLHIVLPLPPNTAFSDAARVAELITERVVENHPEVATVARSYRSQTTRHHLRRRPPKRGRKKRRGGLFRA